ncbi:PREDICTED: uncharacterized protein LOC109115382 [Nelumbo nucifera]|uniref:Uncharacterized protein LOC109115382 n=1 Tax=Nelumbo nucifera TaxID=4432 RepID=A0A1U8Q8I3_NELNU|nr:PREDICTED: uncharacterized protein LOC109115382 [Nelumbo nucifera]
MLAATMPEVIAKDLLKSVQRGKKRKASKKLCWEADPSAPAPSEVLAVEPISIELPEEEVRPQPPVVDMDDDQEEDAQPHEPGSTSVPKQKSVQPHRPESASTPRPKSSKESIMTLRLRMRKSRDAVFPDEVAEWADMSTTMLGSQVVGYCMVVNSAIHSLMCQSEILLKQARDAVNWT